MFKAFCDLIHYMVDNNLILEHLLCGRNWRRKCLLIAMYPSVYALHARRYFFNKDLKFSHVVGDCGSLDEEPFDYNKLSSDPEERARIYSELEAAITNYIFQSLVSYHELLPISVPKNVFLGRGTFIFATRHYDTSDVLLILIPGTEDVRAGQWSRKAIFEEGLNEGSQLPYIKKAIECGYGVMVLNPEDNYRGSSIPHSGTPKEHGIYVWDAYVRRRANATKILIVAHAYGGIVTSWLANCRKTEFENRVVGIALLDSLHVFCEFNVTTHLKQVGKHWVTSDLPLNSPIPAPYFDVTKVSSGTDRPGVTPYPCMNSVFEFFEDRLHTPQVITEQVRLA